MTDDKIPQVIMLPEAQAQIDADPALAKALGGLRESLLNAMQGVKDGRYKSFDDAMEAMTGNRPTAIEPPNPPRFGYFLSLGPNPTGDGLMGVISDGTPQRGHSPIEVLDVEIFSTREEAKEWFDSRCMLLPYETDEDESTT